MPRPTPARGSTAAARPTRAPEARPAARSTKKRPVRRRSTWECPMRLPRARSSPAAAPRREVPGLRPTTAPRSAGLPEPRAPGPPSQDLEAQPALRVLPRRAPPVPQRREPRGRPPMQGRPEDSRKEQTGSREPPRRVEAVHPMPAQARPARPIHRPVERPVRRPVPQAAAHPTTERGSRPVGLPGQRRPTSVRPRREAREERTARPRSVWEAQQASEPAEPRGRLKARPRPGPESPPQATRALPSRLAERASRAQPRPSRRTVE